jgi:hypothetical protein
MKFQPQPPRSQHFLDDRDSKIPAWAWYAWFQLIPARLTSPAVATPPATSNATGIAGQIAYDANFLYLCIATNTWKRVPLTAF